MCWILSLNISISKSLLLLDVPFIGSDISLLPLFFMNLSGLAEITTCSPISEYTEKGALVKDSNFLKILYGLFIFLYASQL